MSKYFFSYAGIDRPLASDVVSGLQSADIDVWWDQNGIGWGEDWQDKLQEGLMTCDAYILLLGKQGIRRWVKPEVEIALCRHYENNLPLFILLHPEVDCQDIPPFLSCIQHRALPDNFNDPDFYADLAKGLKQQTEDPSIYDQEIEPGVCPFPGLESFTEDRADFFFGRQRETAELLLRFAPPNAPFSRWLQIEGNSGVGKSSLVQSGLVPAIRSGWLDESHERYDWHVLLMRPGSDPCQNLFVQLCQSDFAKSPPPSFSKQVELIKDTNGQDKTDLALALKLALLKDSKAKVLLIIDQLEEVITLTTNANDWSEMRQKSRFQAWLNYLTSWRQLQDFKNAGTCSKLEQDFLNASAQRLKLILWVGVLAIIPFTNLVFSATGTKVSAQYANLESWLIHLPIAKARATFFSPKLPNMVPIPKGQLLITENNKTINVPAFNMAKTELTFAEYDFFVFANQAKKAALVNAQQGSSNDAGCFELPEDSGFGRGDRPVIGVSWDCAIEYIAWLNEQPGLKGYRLPSETEWEYAIRANAKPQTDYYWGDQGEAKDFAWFGDNSEDKTHPVAKKTPNAFGLYDMSGNVWEWVQDCYDEKYSNTPTNGTAWNPQECKDGRVLRGGSWLYRRDNLRSATRSGDYPGNRIYFIGFRLAQD